MICRYEWTERIDEGAIPAKNAKTAREIPELSPRRSARDVATGRSLDFFFILNVRLALILTS